MGLPCWFQQQCCWQQGEDTTLIPCLLVLISLLLLRCFRRRAAEHAESSDVGFEKAELDSTCVHEVGTEAHEMVVNEQPVFEMEASHGQSEVMGSFAQYEGRLSCT